MEMTNEIKIEQAETAKALVGKTLIIKGNRKATIDAWVGTNYTVTVDGKSAQYPVVVILDQIKRHLMTIAS